MTSRTKAKQRGTAALEMALLAPAFLAILGLTWAAGMGLWAKYQLTAHVTSAARACAIRSPAVESQMSACVDVYFRTALGETGAGVPCRPSVTSTIGPLSRTLSYLQVDATCDISWESLVQAMTVDGQQWGNTGTFSLHARSAMPFIRPQF